jgi:hypothetical protein
MSASHAYGGDCPGMLGDYHYGGGGLGILGSALAVDGYIYPSLDPALDLAKEYYGLVTSIPQGLTIDIGEAGDFEASANDGAYVVPWDLYEWGGKLDPSTSFAVTFGTGAVRSLIVSNLASAGTLSTVAVSVGAAPGVRNLAIANLRSSSTLSTAAVTVVAANTGDGSTMSFTPSVARTITVNATGNAFSANSTFWNLADPKKPRGWKDPDATVDITFDWGPYLADIADAIRAGGLEFIVDEGLVAVDFTFVGAKCTIFLSGGTFGNGSTVTRAPVTCRITTSSTPPRIEDRTIYLDIEAR